MTNEQKALIGVYCRRNKLSKEDLATRQKSKKIRLESSCYFCRLK